MQHVTSTTSGLCFQNKRSVQDKLFKMFSNYKVGDIYNFRFLGSFQIVKICDF